MVQADGTDLHYVVTSNGYKVKDVCRSRVLSPTQCAIAFPQGRLKDEAVTLSVTRSDHMHLVQGTQNCVYVIHIHKWQSKAIEKPNIVQLGSAWQVMVQFRNATKCKMRQLMQLVGVFQL